MDAAQKKVDQLQQIKDDPYLYASTDGVVLSLDAAAGAETKPESPVAVIGDPNAKTVVVPISQSDIGKIEEGQAVEFTLDAFGDQKFTGKVDVYKRQGMKELIFFAICSARCPHASYCRAMSPSL